MSAQLYYVLGQTEGRRKPFLEWTGIDLYSELSFAYGGNVNYCKSAHHHIPTLTVGIRNTMTIFKTSHWALLSFECTGIFFSWPNWREEKGLFWRVQEGGPHCEINPKSTRLSWKIKKSFFLWNLIISMLGMELYNKFVDRFQDLPKVQNPAVNKAKV